jgi:hypothetical protein
MVHVIVDLGTVEVSSNVAANVGITIYGYDTGGRDGWSKFSSTHLHPIVLAPWHLIWAPGDGESCP